MPFWHPSGRYTYSGGLLGGLTEISCSRKSRAASPQSRDLSAHRRGEKCLPKTSRPGLIPTVRPDRQPTHWLEDTLNEHPLPEAQGLLFSFDFPFFSFFLEKKKIVERPASSPPPVMKSSLVVGVASLCGVAFACVLLLTGVLKPARTELVGYPQYYPPAQRQQLVSERTPALLLGPKAASYVRRWDEQGRAAAMSPKEQILALKAQGVPVIFPSVVTDASGNLKKMVSCFGKSSLLLLSFYLCCCAYPEI